MNADGVRPQDLDDCQVAPLIKRTNILSPWISRLTFASAAACIGFAFYSLCIGAFENWLAMVSSAALLALVASRMTLEDELSPGNEEAAAASKRQRRCSQSPREVSQGSRYANHSLQGCQDC
jgi:hypothetical protein